MIKNKGFSALLIVITLALLAGGGYWVWQKDETGEINNNGSKKLSMQAELEKVYTEYREAVLKKDVEAVIKLMPSKLGDGKTLAERSREEAVKALENFTPELLPALSETKFLKIVERDNNFYYIKAHINEDDGDYLTIGLNRFTKNNGEWTISLTLLTIIKADSPEMVNDDMINKMIDKITNNIK